MTPAAVRDLDAPLRAALAALVDRAHAEVPHVVIAPGDDLRLVAGCLLAWTGFQNLRAAGAPYRSLAEDWEYLARLHAVALGRLATARTNLATLSADGDDCDVYAALFTRAETRRPARRVLRFQAPRCARPSPPGRSA